MMYDISDDSALAPSSPTTSHNFSASSSSSSPGGSTRSRLCSNSELYAAATAMPVILENGRKVFGPPTDFDGPRPSHVCELFIAHVPEQLDELTLLVWLHRFGTVYEFRLMMDSGSSTRGYAFLRFMNESETLAAYDMLSYIFINGERLSVFRSMGKNRLYVSNIPKELPLVTLQQGFQRTFPEMDHCTTYPARDVGETGMAEGVYEQNRGYAFIEFDDHEKALEAKKRTTPGRVRMWGCDLKVQWAKPRKGVEGSKFEGGPETSPIPLKNKIATDFCDQLRLFCLANNWCIPIVVYGRNYHQYGVQYGGILLKHATSEERSYILMEVGVSRICDVHVLMCEVAVQLIEHDAGFPKLHYVVRIVNGVRAEILYSFSALTALSQLSNLNRYLVNAHAIDELATSLHLLAQHSSELILMRYKRSFLTASPSMPTLQLDMQQPFSKFFSVFPKYRNNPPLRNNFNDTEITLIHCHEHAGEQQGGQFRWPPRSLHNSNVLVFRLKSQRSLANLHTNYTLQYVDAAGGFYHPAQLINSHPNWLTGHTYQKSMFEFN